MIKNYTSAWGILKSHKLLFFVTNGSSQCKWSSTKLRYWGRKRIAFPKDVSFIRRQRFYMCGFNKLASRRSEEKTQLTVALLLNVSLPEEEILWYIMGFIGGISSLFRKLSFHMTILFKALSCQPLDFIRNFIWNVCLYQVCTEPPFKDELQMKIIQVKLHGEKNKSKKKILFLPCNWPIY